MSGYSVGLFFWEGFLASAEVPLILLFLLFETFARISVPSWELCQILLPFLEY